MKNKANLSECRKLESIFQNQYSWNLRAGLSQEGQFPTNLNLKNNIKKLI